MPETLLIADVGGSRPRRVPCAGTQCSWELSNVGTLSTFCRLADLRRAGLREDVLGSWLIYDHPRAGRWGGIVTGVPLDDGVAEVTADGWGALLGGQVLDAWERPAFAPPAALVRRALTLAGGGDDAPLFITVGTIDEGGPPVAFTFGGQQLLDDALPELADAGELEWVVDQERRLHAGRRIGHDRSATLRLREGRHVLAPQLADDLATRLPARVYAIESAEASAQRRIRRGQRMTGTATLSQRVDRKIIKRRRFERGGKRKRYTVIIPDIITTTVATYTATIALPELDAGLATWPEQPAGTSTHSLSVPTGKGFQPQTAPVSFQVMDRDDVWRRVDPGDVVRLELGSVGVSGWFRLIVKGLDTTSGLMTWAGEFLPDSRAD